MASNGIQFLRIPELDQVLAGLPGALGDRVIDKVLRKAGQPMLRRARELSSNADASGDTTKSLGFISNRKANSLTFGPRRGSGYKGYVAHILEYGAAPHLIKAKAAGGLLVWAGGAATQVHHPGIAAQPFMRPAFDETNGAVVDSIKAQCREIIESEFKSVFK